MIRFRLFALAVYLLALPYLGIAQSMEASEGQKADTILGTIPFEGKMTETVEDLYTQFSQNPFGLPPSQNQKMMDQFQQSFAPSDLLSDAKEAFRQNYSSSSADSTVKWLESESIRSVLEAEKEFYSLQGIRKRIINRYELEQNPPEEERLKLLEMLGQNKAAVETEVESQIIIFRSLVTAFGELSTRQSLSNSQIEGIIGNFQSQVSSQIHQEVNNQLLLMYHGINADTLEEYIRFYDTGAGTWLRKSRAAALHGAYQSAGDRFLNAIQQL